MKKKGSTRTAAKLLCLLMSVMMSVFAFSGIAMAEDGNTVKVENLTALITELKNPRPKGESAENPTVIQLNAEISDADQFVRVANRNITLDLNGNNLSFKNGGAILVQANGYDFEKSDHKDYEEGNSGTLTITNSQKEGKITSNATDKNYVVQAQNSGTLVLDSVEIDGSGLTAKDGTAVFVAGPDKMKGPGTSCTIQGTTYIHGKIFGVYVTRFETNKDGTEPVTLTVESGKIEGKEGITVDKNTECTINGGTIKASYTDNPDDKSINGVQIMNGGKCTVNGGEISGKAGIWIGYENSELVMNNGKVSGTAFGITGNGTEGQGDTKITITGGTIEAEKTGAGMYLPQSGTVTIEDADNDAANGPAISGGCGIVQRAGKLTITGGTVKATAETELSIGDAKAGDDPVKVNPSAVVVDSQANYPGVGVGGTSVDIQGGTFKAEEGQDVLSNRTEAGDKDITVKGGHFSGNTDSLKGFVKDQENTVYLEEKKGNVTEYHVGNKAAEEALQAATADESFTLESGTLNASGVKKGTNLKVENDATATVNGVTTVGTPEGAQATVCEHPADQDKMTVMRTAKCTKTGLTRHTCGVCEYTYFEVTTKDHTVKEGTVQTKVQATCLTDGIETYTCDECKNPIDREVTAKGHTFVTKETHEADCLTDGYTLEECSNKHCEYKEGAGEDANDGANQWNEDTEKAQKKTKTGDKLGHDIDETLHYADDTVNHAEPEDKACVAGEGEEGMHWQLCKRCGAHLNAAKHVLSDPGEEPQCVTPGGHDATTCTQCRASIEKAVEAPIGHKFIDPDENPEASEYGVTWYWKGDTDGTKQEQFKATCAQSNSKVLICQNANCDKVITSDVEGYDQYIADATGVGVNDFDKNKAIKELPQTVVEHTYPSEELINSAKEAVKEQVTTKDSQAWSQWITAHDEEADADKIKWTSQSNTDCSIDQTLTIQCKNCINTKTETVQIDDQDYADDNNYHDYQMVVTTPATCHSTGTKTKKCTRCDKVYKDAEGKEETEEIGIDSTAHTYGPEELKEATCVSPMYAGRFCTQPGCNAVDVKTVGVYDAPHDHHFVKMKDISKPAGCETDGYTIYQCDNPDCNGVISQDELGKYDKDFLEKIYPYASEDNGGDANHGAIDSKAVLEAIQKVDSEFNAKLDAAKAYKVVVAGDDTEEAKTLKKTGHIPEASVEEKTHDATCLKDSYCESIYCSKCDEELIGEFNVYEAAVEAAVQGGMDRAAAEAEFADDKAHGHNFKDPEPQEFEAGCETPGGTISFCQNEHCDGYIDSPDADNKDADGAIDGIAYKLNPDAENYPASGHNFVNWVEETDITAEEKGTGVVHKHTAYCENENCEHYNEAKGGTKKVVTYTAEEIQAAEFKTKEDRATFTQKGEAKAATCASPKLTTYTCNLCGKELSDLPSGAINENNHTWAYTKIENEYGYENAYHMRYCTNAQCPLQKNEPERVKCELGEPNKVEEQNCQHGTINHYTCAYCENTCTNEVDKADPEKHVEQWHSIRTATHTKSGFGRWECAAEGDDDNPVVTVYQVIPAGHLFGDGEEPVYDYNTAAQHTLKSEMKKINGQGCVVKTDNDTDGLVVEYTCLRDGCTGRMVADDESITTGANDKAVKTVTTPGKGHKLATEAEVTSEQTCTTDGYELYICDNPNCSGDIETHPELNNGADTTYVKDGKTYAAVKKNVMEKLSHTFQLKHEQSEESCTEEYYPQTYYQCTTCKKYFTSQDDPYSEAGVEDETGFKRAPAGHNCELFDGGEVPADCKAKENGHDAYYQCTRCDNYFNDEDGTEPTTPDQHVTKWEDAHEYEYVDDEACEKWPDLVTNCVHGDYVQYCTKCGVGKDEQELDLNYAQYNHSYMTDGHVDENAKYTTEPSTSCKRHGVRVYTCDNPGCKEHVEANEEYFGTYGYEYRVEDPTLPVGPHKVGSEYVNDGATHYQICEECSEHVNVAPHVYDQPDGKCICGAEIPETLDVAPSAVADAAKKTLTFDASLTDLVKSLTGSKYEVCEYGMFFIVDTAKQYDAAPENAAAAMNTAVKMTETPDSVGDNPYLEVQQSGVLFDNKVFTVRDTKQYDGVKHMFTISDANSDKNVYTKAYVVLKDTVNNSYKICYTQVSHTSLDAAIAE